uniref:Reverse transcriptase domain-containing protein n=1 Tax=Myripristis murdjan TaxID=586833 RepID=A0A667Z0D5_9TELE
VYRVPGLNPDLSNWGSNPTSGPLLQVIPSLPAFPVSPLGGTDVITSRHIGPSAVAAFSQQLPGVLAPLTVETGSVENLTSSLNVALSSLLDTVAPLSTRPSRLKRSTPWFNEEIRALKQACRRLERQWRKSKLVVFYLSWHDSLLKYKRALAVAKAAYFSRLIATNKHNPRFLFETVAKLTKKQPSATSISLTADDFLDFFGNKVEEIRQKINSESAAAPADSLAVASSPIVPTISVFEAVSLDTLSKLVIASKPTTCFLDPLPAKLYKESWPLLGSTMLDIVNLSLSTGIVPSSFKTAVVRPLLKKPHLDSSSLNSYRPVSNLPFMSKVLERVVFQQLSTHLAVNQLYEPFQSAFRACHSAETALTRVANDLLLAIDADSTSVLLLLDLSAAFDTVDHSILLDKLTENFGVTGQARAWLNSYLSERTQCVMYNNTRSKFSNVKCGVPQGSVLGPLLFSLYISPLGQIIRSHGINFHCYADDTQLYLPIKADDPTEINRLEVCLAAVKNWMSLNFLLLNSDKTEMLVVGPPRHRHCFEQLTVLLDNCVISQSVAAKNLGVTFDPCLSFDRHIKDITKTAYFHLRNIAQIRSSLSMADTETLIHALVSARLDYCNVLFSGLPRASTKSLQMVQNAAARVLTRTRKFDHITPILASLHWLPVHIRSDFKVLLLTYKILNGFAPSYLSDLLKPYIPSRALRSQNAGLLCLPRIKKKSAGGRAFSYRAPLLWNNLPADVRQSESVDSFKSRLKTHLFGLTYG